MKNDMFCPFCGSELEYNIDDMLCPNANCSEYHKEYAPHIWQALIDGKRALDTLKEIENLLQRHFVREQEDGFTVNWDVIAKIIKDKITSITKGG